MPGAEDDNLTGRLGMSLDELVAADGYGSSSQIIDSLAKQLGLRPAELSFLQELPLPVQRSISQNFDSSGTKDGNTLGRLEAYARSVARRANVRLPASFVRPVRSEDGAVARPGLDKKVKAFVRGLDMDDTALDLMGCLADDMQAEIIDKFDSSGTRDGQVWNRFFSYVRGLWLRRLGVDADAAQFVTQLPQEAQLEVIMQFDPSGTKDGNVSARLSNFAERVCPGHGPGQRRAGSVCGSSFHDSVPHQFVRRWRLEDIALEVLESIPKEVLREVTLGFDAANTRDGNVMGRFLGFVRLKWAQHFDLDDECVFAMKRLPPEGQIMCFTDFDAASTRDGNVSARLLSFLRKVEVHVDHRSGSSDAVTHQQVSSTRPDKATRKAILDFVRYWDLDMAVGAYLESLQDQSLLDAVLEEFDPSGTQDGNVLGRLQAFVRLLSGKRQRGEQASRRKADSRNDYDSRGSRYRSASRSWKDSWNRDYDYSERKESGSMRDYDSRSYDSRSFTRRKRAYSRTDYDRNDSYREDYGEDYSEDDRNVRSWRCHL